MSGAWLELVTSLPTENATERMRVWRTLKATGAGGAPRRRLRAARASGPARRSWRGSPAEIDEAGGSAHVLRVEARDADQAEALARPVRSDEGLRRAGREIAGVRAAASHAGSGRPPPSDAGRSVDSSTRSRPSTSFPARPRRRSRPRCWRPRRPPTEILSPGEPHGRQRAHLRGSTAAQYRRRVWATRKAPWVDRLACAWLIKRHIDPAASFVWLESPADLPRKAVGSISTAPSSRTSSIA